MMDRRDMVELSLEFAGLAEQISSTADGTEPLQRMVDLAVSSIDGCRYATISTFRGRPGQPVAASHETARQLDQLQIDLDEGPSLDVVRVADNYLIAELIRESRWPRFAAATIESTDVRSVLTFRLAGNQPATLTLYSHSTDGFSDKALDTATIFASHAATLMALLAAEGHSANLETALRSSREIGMALGILMAHRKITHEVAFELLRTASQNLHRKLRDVAGEVMQTGTLPELPTTSRDRD